jgi:flagellar basal-body rod protein FlgG
MNPTLRIGATGMRAAQARVDVLANNIANVSTNGFKRSRAVFTDLLYQTIQGPTSSGLLGLPSQAPIQIGRGVRLLDVARLPGQGTLEQTGRELDLAIQGEGFFQIQRPDGVIGYARAGAFTLSADGRITTPDGNLLAPEIQVPEGTTSIAIGPTGVVSVSMNGDINTMVEVGRVELVRFTNPAGLEATGDGLFRETMASGMAFGMFPGDPGVGTLRQGYLESSNVDIVVEMTDLIEAQRAYEVNGKVIQTADEMSSRAVDLVR